MIDHTGTALRGLRLVAVLALAATAAGCGDDDKKGAEERVVYAEGITVHLAKLQGGSLVDVSAAALPAAGLLDGHTIFSIAKHPTQDLLFVTSFNDCYDETNWCWGNGRVDVFRVSRDRVTYQGPAFLYDENAADASCAQEPTDYEGQVGYCAPVYGTFSPDGSRYYVQEDDNDLLHIFSVAGGALTFLHESAQSSVDLHGLARHPTLPLVYNGTTVLDVTGDEAASVLSGTGGNDTTVVDAPTGPDLLLTTIGTTGLGIYSLEDPEAPAELDRITLQTGGVTRSNASRTFAYDAGRGRAVAAGRNNVSVLEFDGEALTEADFLDNHAGEVTRENRGVALLGGGSVAAVGWFEVSEASPSGFVGGVSIFTVAEDGSLTAGATLTAPRSVRVVRAMTLD